MKQVAAAVLSLCVIAAFAWTVAGKREIESLPVTLRANRSIRIPSSACFREPVEIDPIALGVRANSASPSFVRQIEGLQQTGDIEGVNSLLPVWFQTDPEAVREWLIKRGDLTALQPALAAIACHLSTSGNAILALEWTNLLDDPSLREDARCAILALGRRQEAFSDESLFAAGVPPHRLERILSGAEGD